MCMLRGAVNNVPGQSVLPLPVQDAKADINDLGVSKGTLQPKHGIHMYCTPRM